MKAKRQFRKKGQDDGGLGSASDAVGAQDDSREAAAAEAAVKKRKAKATPRALLSFGDDAVSCLRAFAGIEFF